MLVGMLGKRKADEFSPLDITNCGLWLKADVGLTLIEGKVSQWDDQSGNSRHFVQSNADYRPTYEATGLNGSPCVYFNQTHCLSRSNDSLVRNINGATVIAVFESGGNLALGGYVFFFATNSGSQRFIAYHVANSSNGYIYGRRLDADDGDPSDTANGLFVTDVAHVYGWIADWANNAAYIRRGGEEVLADTTWGTSGYSSDTSSTFLSIGAGGTSPTAPVWGRLAEFLVYQKTLTSGELSQVEEYMGVNPG